MTKCPKCGCEMEKEYLIPEHGYSKIQYRDICSNCIRKQLIAQQLHEQKVGAKSSSLEHSKNIALGYPTDAQMDEAVRRTKEKVGGKCQTCGKELPEPQMNLCSDCFDKNGHTKGVRITKKVGGEKIRWPKNQVWCTGGKHPKPCIPKFDENGVIISSIGCSHSSSVKDCECDCHKKVGVRVVATGNTGAYDGFGLPVVGGEKA